MSRKRRLPREGPPPSPEEVEVVENYPSWEECVSEFIEGSRHEIAGQLRQARAAAAVVSVYGKSSMKQFASEVGKSPSWVYDLARVWVVFGHIFDGGDELSEAYSERLETLGISHFVKALAAPDPVALVERAHDEGLTTREVEAEARGEETSGSNVEVVDMLSCPHCGGVFKMREAQQWSEGA